MNGEARALGLPPLLAARLPELRRKYGLALFFIDRYGGILFRPLTREELIRHERNAGIDSTTAQIDLLRSHILYPENLDAVADKISLRDVHALAEAIIRASGFRSGTFIHDLNMMRMAVLERDYAIIRHICKAFPTLNPMDIDKLNRQDIIYLLAQAEMALGITYDGIEIDEDVLVQLQAYKQSQEHKKTGQSRAKTFDWERDEVEKFRGDWDVSDIDRQIG